MNEKLKELAEKLKEKGEKCNPYNEEEFMRGVIYEELAEMIMEILDE